MMDAYIALMVMTFSLLVIFGGFFIWGLKTGQFHNPEETKYRIFRNEKNNRRGGGNDS